MTPKQITTEYLKCKMSLLYFTFMYCMIEEPKQQGEAGNWIPFALWPFQVNVLRNFLKHALITILKARQLGLTWLVVAYALWLALFRPGSVILIFSAGDTEAKELLARIKGMHERLPEWLQASVSVDNDHQYEFELLGSRIRAFASTKKAGRSFTATLVVLDEADWITWFSRVMAAVKPTVEGGGQLIMLSTPDKEKPASGFKNIWKAAQAKINSYLAIFLSWSVHPHRNEDWYKQEVANAETLDDVHQEYPATPVEALSGRASSKRFKPEWLDACSDFIPPASQAGPALPGLAIYVEPNPGWHYVIAVDTAEGDVTSDPSPATVFCVETWEEVAHIWGRFEPSTLADYVIQLSDYYQQAVICMERNNHGHAVHVTIILSGHEDRLYINPFDNKHGWLSSVKYKTLAVNNAATVFKAGDCTLRTETSVIELGGIQASTLKALEGETDDRAMSKIIGLAALRWPTAAVEPGGGMQVRARR